MEHTFRYSYRNVRQRERHQSVQRRFYGVWVSEIFVDQMLEVVLDFPLGPSLSGDIEDGTGSNEPFAFLG
jgi:hypothetical protein